MVLCAHCLVRLVKAKVVTQFMLSLHVAMFQNDFKAADKFSKVGMKSRLDWVIAHSVISLIWFMVVIKLSQDCFKSLFLILALRSNKTCFILSQVFVLVLTLWLADILSIDELVRHRSLKSGSPLVSGRLQAGEQGEANEIGHKVYNITKILYHDLNFVINVASWSLWQFLLPDPANSTPTLQHVNDRWPPWYYCTCHKVGSTLCRSLLGGEKGPVWDKDLQLTCGQWSRHTAATLGVGGGYNGSYSAASEQDVC